MIVSKHGEERTCERFGISKWEVNQLIKKSLFEGKGRREFRGPVRNYLDKVFLNYGSWPTIRVYEDYLFIFGRDDTLITMWKLPAIYCEGSGFSGKTAEEEPWGYGKLYEKTT